VSRFKDGDMTERKRSSTGARPKPAVSRGARSKARQAGRDRRPPSRGGGEREESDGAFEIPGRALDAMSHIAATTASLLEKELAVGIQAAKFVERRILDVDRLRSSDPEGWLPRFRQGAHEVLDMFVDVISIASRSLGDQARGIVSITSGPRTRPDEPVGGRVTVLQMPGPLMPGQTGERILLLANDDDAPTGELSFASSDLVAPSGARIPASQVYFDPPALAVGPRRSGKVVVGVTVPDGLPSGSYEGLLLGAPVEGHRTVLRVDLQTERAS